MRKEDNKSTFGSPTKSMRSATYYKSDFDRSSPLKGGANNLVRGLTMSDAIHEVSMQ